jgi:hypothetical protein
LFCATTDLLCTERNHPLYCYIFGQGDLNSFTHMIRPHELGPYNDMLTIDAPTIANFADAASFPRHQNQQTTSFSEPFHFLLGWTRGSGALWPCLSTCNAVLVCVKKGRFWAGPFVWDLLRSCGAVMERLDHTEREKKRKRCGALSMRISFRRSIYEALVGKLKWHWEWKQEDASR